MILKQNVYRKPLKIRKPSLKKGALALLTGILLALSVGGQTTYAEEANGGETTYIYHRHLGDKTQEGGCYTQPVYHVHTGDEVAGGGCYNEPVYHVHEGEQSSGGNCYQTPVYHVHTGNETEGGGCYTPRYHSHGGSCYVKKKCRIEDTNIGYCVSTWEGDCYHHGQVTYGKFECTEVHHGCGKAPFKTLTTMCFGCREVSSSHEYQSLVCGQDGVLEGYNMTCGKTEESIDGYECSCDKNAETIDSYNRNCAKEDTTIEEYAVACGMDEESAIGSIQLVNKTDHQAKHVELEAVFTDYQDNYLLMGEQPYTWQDEQGNVIGTEKTITVSANGEYSLTMQLLNEDIDNRTPFAKVSVTNIKPPVQEETNDDNTESEPEQTQEPEPETPKVITPKPTEAVTLIEEPEFVPVKHKAVPVEIKATPIPTPQLLPEKETVKIEKKLAPQTQTAQVQTVNEQPKKTIPVIVKAAGIATSTLFAVGLLLFGLFVLISRVRIYNEDGEGRYAYLGSGLMRKDKEAWSLTIGENITQLAYTHNYCIRFSYFFSRRHLQEEILVSIGEEKHAVFVDREVLFTSR